MMVRISVQYDVKQTSQDGTGRTITDERGWFPGGETITDAIRADVLADAENSIPTLNGNYGGWWCEFSNPRIYKEFNF